jgi:excisionase family DNA binding protein
MATVEHAEYLTVEEAARFLRQSEATVRRKIAHGEIAAVRLGRCGPLRVQLDSLEEHLRPVGRARAGRDDAAGKEAA